MTGLSRLLAILLFLLLLACSGPSDDPPESARSAASPGGLDAEAIALNNRGVGLMGRFEYEPARQVFASLIEQHPDWTDVDVNLAIATLNRQEEGDGSGDAQHQRV